MRETREEGLQQLATWANENVGLSDILHVVEWPAWSQDMLRAVGAIIQSWSVLSLSHSSLQNLVRLVSENVQLTDVLHIVDWGSMSEDIRRVSYHEFNQPASPLPHFAFP